MRPNNKPARPATSNDHHELRWVTDDRPNATTRKMQAARNSANLIGRRDVDAGFTVIPQPLDA
jgi:hypothetical protein